VGGEVSELKDIIQVQISAIINGKVEAFFYDNRIFVDPIDYQEDTDNLEAHIADLEARIAKVRERHQPIEANHPQIKSEICEECSRPDEGEFTFHPCPTIRDLDEVTE
jgi:hypothetical protein